MKNWIMRNKLIGVILLGLALVGATNYSRLVAGNYGINNTAKPQLIVNPMAEYNTNNITLTNAVITMEKLADWQDVAAKGVFKVVNNLSVGAVRTAFQVIPPKGEFLSGMCQIELLYNSARPLQLTTNNSMITMVLPPTPTNTLMMAAPQLPCSNLTTVVVSDETGGTGTGYYIGKLFYKKADGPFVAQPENTARAFVDASGNISNKSGPDIFNNGPFTPSDTSLYAISLKGLTQTPSCDVEYYSRATFETAASFFAQKEGTQSNTVLTVRTFYNNPAGANRLKAAGAFTISCTLNGSDNIKNVVPVSSLDTDWVTYTPVLTGFTVGGANALNTGKWRRAGPNVEIQISTRMGSTGTSSGIFTWSLPSGMEIDYTRISTESSGIRILPSSATWFDRSALSFKPVNASATNTNEIWLVNSSSPVNNMSNDLSPTNSDDSFSIQISIPIKGWDAKSSGVMVYVDTVKVRATKSTVQSIAPSTQITVTFWNEVEDSMGFFNPTTGIFSPTHGTWWCQANARLTFSSQSWAAGNTITASFVGVLTSNDIETVTLANQAFVVGKVSDAFKISAGESIRLTMWIAGTGDKYTDSDSTRNNFSITCTPY